MKTFPFWWVLQPPRMSGRREAASAELLVEQVFGEAKPSQNFTVRGGKPPYIARPVPVNNCCNIQNQEHPEAMSGTLDTKAEQTKSWLLAQARLLIRGSLCRQQVLPAVQ